MTSTCDGLDGPSFGFINRGFIEAGREDAHFNNQGAEDRLWLAPKGVPIVSFSSPELSKRSTIGSRRRISIKGLSMWRPDPTRRKSA